jgi:hypothetical protein
MTRPDDDREVPEPTEDEADVSVSGALPLEAESADVLEQGRTVPTEEDEYRPD